MKPIELSLSERIIEFVSSVCIEFICCCCRRCSIGSSLLVFPLLFVRFVCIIMNSIIIIMKLLSLLQLTAQCSSCNFATMSLRIPFTKYHFHFDLWRNLVNNGFLHLPTILICRSYNWLVGSKRFNLIEQEFNRKSQIMPRCGMCGKSMKNLIICLNDLISSVQRLNKCTDLEHRRKPNKTKQNKRLWHVI